MKKFTTIEILIIVMICIIIPIAIISGIYTTIKCFPYWFKPVSEAPLICVMGGNRTGIIINSK